MGTIAKEEKGKDVSLVDFEHEPVLVEEVLGVLTPQPGDIFVDGTVGGGGHSRRIIERILPGGKLIAIDQDEEALQAARKNLADFSDHVTFVRDNFGNLGTILNSLGISGVDGILLDIGVSSYQLDNDDRGFSYHANAPLDMRMNNEGRTSAADLVNRLDARDLTRIIRNYGEELWAARIAKFIVDRRQAAGPIQTTGELVDVIKAAIPARARRRGPHPARRTFQALRIAVNDELDVFEKAITEGIARLNSGGRLAVITFHSLEDRIAKKTFRDAAAICHCPPGLPQCICGSQPIIKIITGKALQPGEDEKTNNPRSRSAKLRAVYKF